ncbi:serine hydrolase domain-containing protein [Nocardia sp. NPDC003693]
MSTAASSPVPAEPSTSVGGYSAPEFAPLVRAFARRMGDRPGAGASLAVHRHGVPLVEVWTGEAAPGVAWTANTGSVVFSATKGIAATVIHRLADRGLLDYDAPVAAYWPEFGAAGKDRITVRQLLSHRAGLSGLPDIARGLDDVMDHRLMERQLAAAKPDHLLGIPTYHALTFGWLLAGLARAITGRGMGELFRTEIAEPLGTDGIHLGRPGPDSATTTAVLHGNRLAPVGSTYASLVLGRAYGVPGAAGAAARALFLPGLEAFVDGDDPPINHTELPAGNGICTASGLATLYGALACGGMSNGHRFLTPRTMQAVRRIESYRLDHALFYIPMLWHMGYHSLPVPGARTGFGHIGLGGSFGWADPSSGVSIGFVHNRLALPALAADQLAAGWVLPLTMRGARSARRAPARPAGRAA